MVPTETSYYNNVKKNKIANKYKHQHLLQIYICFHMTIVRVQHIKYLLKNMSWNETNYVALVA